VAILAGAAFLVGVVLGALHSPPEKDVAERFVAAWEKGDYAAMHRLLDEDARRRYPLASFREAYRQSALMATAVGVSAGDPGEPGDGTVPVPVRVRTRIFGTVGGTLRLPFTGDGNAARVDWRPELTFPGVERGQRLSRSTRLPQRATLLARDGQVLAQGADRTGELGAIAPDIVGQMGPMPPEDRDRLLALGYPEDATVGTSGLERALQVQLAGRPGGTLSIGGRVIARTGPVPARPVRTTISPKLEQAAINALAGQSGGIAVLQPGTGEVLGLAGTAYSATGPPGSIFKIITTTAALEDRKVRLDERFPVETAAVLEGVRLSNAGGEACGGTFVNSFAHSCNSVFAPIGVRVGKQRLVEVAERYGFNQRPAIPGAAMSQIPQPSGIGDDLDLGSTAIGQGKVVTTPLAMAAMAAVVANRGRLVPPHVLDNQRVRPVRVTTPAIAATIRRLMIGVVKGGTGTAADIPGVQVAGKTGTAELGGDLTDAWFVAFAPARRPTVAVAVWRLRGSSGGQAAAPLARQVLASALGRG
jgi:penicillin-binding protein A